ncbi:MAG: DUF1553 domain-containing protein [Acidobacteria bacterium]|nr:DUF1553 domain-containing protein [Acidobacteriota bacterium]MBI3279879.1 DUF1553 domain-containing protein [Acidobacteriota bacterium]
MRRNRYGKTAVTGAFLLTGALAVMASSTGGNSGLFTPAQTKHWAFQKIKTVEPPAVKEAGWVKNPIDSFIAAKLESRGVRPNPPADKITLLRRVTFDLTGLPPTPDEVDAFVADTTPKAFEKVVDRLLASPRYGERWARHWLDLARYAESEGFKSDETRPNAWRYRDYVIKSFNDNKPYDRFVKEQIAGDELWPDDPDARIATAFLRHYPDESNARNLMQRRQEILDDVTDTTALTFMGLTYGCARCHNHKYDPILQADYYRLQAFFANTAAADEIALWPAEKARAHREALAVWEEKTKPIREEMAALLEPHKQKVLKEFVDKYPAEIQAILSKSPAERNPYEWQMYYKAKPYLVVDDNDAARRLKGEQKQRYEALKADLKKFDDINPGEAPMGIGMRDISASAPATHILSGGVYSNPTVEVQPGFLTLLDPNPAKIAPPPGLNSTGRRTALAAWLTDPSNPLTARVTVNRLWHYHFGQGIVATPSDFGLMGQRPSHPELLDWLATEFVRSGWDIKRLHKLIVTSNTYQQSSAHNEVSAKEDGRNRLFWKFPRQRLEGEVIRDSALHVSGMLNTAMGGPSVMPELPDGMPTPRGGWKVSPAEERNRRSVYIFVRRNARYPLLEAFDMPDTHESCGRRNVTITAPQALSLLNDKISMEWAEGFARRVLASTGNDVNRQVETAYRLAYSRRPDGAEKDTILTFFANHEQIIGERFAKGEKVALSGSLPEGAHPVHAAALVDFCHMLLNSNEFVYRN